MHTHYKYIFTVFKDDGDGYKVFKRSAVAAKSDERAMRLIASPNLRGKDEEYEFSDDAWKRGDSCGITLLFWNCNAPYVASLEKMNMI